MRPPVLARRRFLVGAATLGAALAAAAVACRDDDAPARPQEPSPIAQPPEPNPEAFARYAEQMRAQASAAGDQSFGAVVVLDDIVVGLGPSRVVALNDATAHAEMEAVRDASRRLGRADLSGAVLYSTSRPCRMCETAAYWARIARMVHGIDATDAGAPNCS